MHVHEGHKRANLRTSYMYFVGPLMGAYAYLKKQSFISLILSGLFLINGSIPFVAAFDKQLKIIEEINYWCCLAN